MWTVPQRHVVGSVYATTLFTALVGLGVLVETRPLSSNRPSNGGRGAKATSGVIEARLWDDPLRAIEGEGAAPLPIVLDDARDRQTLVLGMWLSGKSYAEDRESHIRTRYAVISALNTAGYEPKDNEHIRFYGDAIQVPYEEFIADKNRIAEKTHEFDRVMVLWINEESLCSVANSAEPPAPLARMASLVDEFLKGVQHKPAIAIIGPTNSNSLAYVVSELSVAGGPSAAESPRYEPLRGATIYSTWSTTPADLLPIPSESVKWNETKTTLHAEGIDVKLIRGTASDEQLTSLLCDELRLRGIEPSSEPIALFAEWDTLYGRSLPRQFRDTATSTAKDAADPEGNSTASRLRKPQIEIYSYLRGLDGALPDSNDPVRPLALTAPAATSNLEQPEDSTQGDYAVRLAEQLSKGDRKFSAIGILGSDVYDKLLILQALRPHFPSAVFFTTDLDARLTHSSQRDFTRNLLIASPFGLRLSPKHQGESPPFRSSYQTALYRSALAALNNDAQVSLAPAALTPRILEVTRNGEFDLSGPDTFDTHPIGDRTTPPHWATVLSKFAAILLAAFLLLCPVWWPALCWAVRQEANLRWILFGSVALAILLFVLLYLVAIYDDCRVNGECFTWSEGLSIWPATFFYLLAFELAVAFCVSVVFVTKESHRQITNRFFPSAPYSQEQDPFSLGWPISRRRVPRRISIPYTSIIFRWPYKVHWPLYRDMLKCWMPIRNESSRKDALWKSYCSLSKLAFYRTVWLALAAVMLAVLVVQLRGIPPVPYRGELSKVVYVSLLAASAISLFVLTCLVLDVTLRCTMMMSWLTEGVSEWRHQYVSLPKKVDADDSAQWEAANHFLDISFIAMLTESVRSLVYYPLIVILVMLFGQVRYFDNWYLSGSLLMLFSIPFLIVIIAAIVLRTVAETTRQRALEELRDLEHTNRNSVVPLIDRLERLNRGAFCSWKSDPVVGAILIPLVGGISVLALQWLVPQ